MNCMAEVPLTRFDVEPYFDLGPRAGGKSYVRHGMFIDGVELFGNGLFGIGPAEANVMAPEQRHLLEAGLMASAGAAWDKVALMGSSTGCFVG